MNRKVGLVVDSTFGLNKAFVKEHHITVVPLQVLIDDKEYTDGLINPDVVVSALQQGKLVKTSQPTPEQFIKAYKEQLEMFSEVICLTLSKTLSGTINSATLAQTIFSDPNVHVVDSETTINGGLYLVEELVKFLNDNKSASEGLNYLEELKDKGSLIFTVDNLQTLVRNGRIGKVQAFIGNVLKIKPILRFRRGVLELEHKVRSFKNVILYLTEEVKKMMNFGKVTVYIAFVDRSIEAKELEHELFQLGDQVSIKISGVISPVVSAHVGLGGLGIYLTNE
ncbi:MAG: DegV family protein [Acholeplasmataceae bacterium]|jgi:DegV family protein with EDD domain|nr:DegV family protein [Acholeplasmataceae bacterium]